MNSAIADEAQRKAAVSPYLQLTVLVFAAGVIYPLLYLRQNFEVSMLETFNITNSQLGECYSMLGVLFTLTYLPSGWLADRVSPRKLLSFSLAMTGLLGIWYWTIPSFGALQVIFAGWGVTTGLTFWAALIKETTLIAGENRQGRFFGVLEGGRGVVEATLASLAVAGFAWAVSNMDATTPQALRHVILMYVVVLLAMAPIVYLTISESDDSPRAEKEETGHGTFRNTMMLLGNEQIWLCAICIFAGYTLFYSTYSFAGFLQTEMSLSAVMVGWITVGRLWMRPIGGVLAGFIADRWHVERVLVV
ncbi:MAG: MFS transporter, partial [Pseudomonadales bacterium]|nr:MFS transporter [Pseudomonadales bacterium]